MDNPEMPIQNKQRKERPAPEGTPLPNRESGMRPRGSKKGVSTPLPPPPTPHLIAYHNPARQYIYRAASTPEITLRAGRDQPHRSAKLSQLR